MTIRNMIAERRDRILSSKPISKDELANIGIELATLLVNVGQNCAKLEQKAYNYKKKRMQNGNFSDAKAETFMRSSNHWRAFREAKILYETTQELIRMIKTKIKDVTFELENL